MTLVLIKLFLKVLLFIPELSRYTVDPGKFCVDMVDKDKHQFMSVVFCSPKAISYVKEDLLVLSVPNAGVTYKNSVFAIATLCLSFYF